MSADDGVVVTVTLTRPDLDLLRRMRDRAERARSGYQGWPTERTYVAELSLIDRMISSFADQDHPRIVESSPGTHEAPGPGRVLGVASCVLDDGTVTLEVGPRSPGLSRIATDETAGLSVLLRRYFEVYDRPCQPDGDWAHVSEFCALDVQLRKLVGAPESRSED